MGGILERSKGYKMKITICNHTELSEVDVYKQIMKFYKKVEISSCLAIKGGECSYYPKVGKQILEMMFTFYTDDSVRIIVKYHYYSED